eukprot:1777003-Prymnesium_polylepis.2
MARSSRQRATGQGVMETCYAHTSRVSSFHHPLIGVRRSPRYEILVAPVVEFRPIPRSYSERSRRGTLLKRDKHTHAEDDQKYGEPQRAFERAESLPYVRPRVRLVGLGDQVERVELHYEERTYPEPPLGRRMHPNAHIQEAHAGRVRAVPKRAGAVRRLLHDVLRLGDVDDEAGLLGGCHHQIPERPVPPVVANVRLSVWVIRALPAARIRLDADLQHLALEGFGGGGCPVESAASCVRVVATARREHQSGVHAGNGARLRIHKAPRIVAPKAARVPAAGIRHWLHATAQLVALGCIRAHRPHLVVRGAADAVSGGVDGHVERRNVACEHRRQRRCIRCTRAS